MAAEKVPYYPSAEAESKFWQAQGDVEEGTARVPDGFPTHLDSPLAWTRKSVESQEDKWIFNLTPEHVTAIEGALNHFEGKQ